MEITKETKLIGIGGIAHSGKDTVAAMIDFILNSDNPTFRGYEYYMHNAYNKEECYNIISFADALKNILSQIYNIPREYFDNTEMKDNGYYLFDKAEVVTGEDLPKHYHIYPVNTFDMPLAVFINYHEGKAAIKLRTLMQYFGTNIMREKMGNTVWIDACIRKAKRIMYCGQNVIISDVRFTNEAKAIKNAGGVLIKVRRNPEIEINHPSEKVNFHADIEINNIGTLEDLFNKIKKVIKV